MLKAAWYDSGCWGRHHKTLLLLLVLALRKHCRQAGDSWQLGKHMTTKITPLCIWQCFIFIFLQGEVSSRGLPSEDLSEPALMKKIFPDLKETRWDILCIIHFLMCPVDAMGARQCFFTDLECKQVFHGPTLFFRPNCSRRSCGCDSRKIFPKKGAKGFLWIKYGWQWTKKG